MKFRYLLAILALVLIAACNPDEDTVYRESNDLSVKLIPLKPYSEDLVPLPDGSVITTCRVDRKWDYYLAKIYPDGTVDSFDYCFLNSDQSNADEVPGCLRSNAKSEIFIDNSQLRAANKYRLIKLDQNLNTIFDISGGLGNPDYSIVGNAALNSGEYVFVTKYISWDDDAAEYFSFFLVSADGVVGEEVVLPFLCGKENISDVCCIGDEILITYTFNYSVNKVCFLNPHDVSQYEVVNMDRSFDVFLCDSKGRILGCSTEYATIGYRYHVGSLNRDGSTLVSDLIVGNALTCLYASGDDVLAVGYRILYSTDVISDVRYKGFIYDVDINTGAIKDSVIMDYGMKPFSLTSDGKGGYNLYLERMFKYVDDANHFNTSLDNIYIYNISDLHDLQFSSK